MSTKFVLTLKDSSLSGIDSSILEGEYDNFCLFLFSETDIAMKQDRMSFLNILNFTHVELSALARLEDLKRNTVASICLEKALDLTGAQIEWVKQQIQAEQAVCHCPFRQQSETEIQWTSRQIYLVELIYALHEMKCFNDGNISLKDLFYSMGKCFGIKIKDFYNCYNNIKNRKERTVFLDKLRAVLIESMNVADNKPYIL